MPVKINGSTSGSVTLAAPATGSDVTLTLPTDLNAKAPLNLSVNPQTGTSYTLTTSDSSNIITMTNAAASTVTIPLNSSAAIPIGTSTEIVNLSTGVNTTVSAAGGVTFNGGPVVLSPGSSVTLVKIGTDAWMAQGQGSPGLVHIASSSFSASAGVSLNNIFTSSYTNYQIVIRAGLSGVADLNMRLRASGSDLTTSTYWMVGVAAYDAGTPTIQASSTGVTSTWRVCTGDSQYYAVINIFDPQTADPKNATLHSMRRGSTLSIIGQLLNTTASAYDGLTLYPASGTMTGAIRIYGYRNS